MSVEDFDGVLARIPDYGGEVIAATNVGLGVFVRDPDGQLVELLPIAYRDRLGRCGTCKARGSNRAGALERASEQRGAGVEQDPERRNRILDVFCLWCPNRNRYRDGRRDRNFDRNLADGLRPALRDRFNRGFHGSYGPAAPVVEPPTPGRCQQLGMTFTELAGTRGAVAGLVEPHSLALRVERERRRRSRTASRSRTLSTHA